MREALRSYATDVSAMTRNEDTESASIDPKIARLEAVTESITRDAVQLTQVVAELSHTVALLAKDAAEQFRVLSNDVTRATGPRKVEWQIIGVAGTLIFAIGAAVMGPVTWRLDSLHDEVHALDIGFTAHEKLVGHMGVMQRVNEVKRIAEIRSDALVKELDIVRTQGTPITSSRLSVLESELTEVQRRINALHPASGFTLREEKP